jgi:hypothetical protein
MMYDQVLSKPGGGDLQDRVENYFLAWSNSERRDLEALGMLDSPGGTDALFGIYPAAMTDEQLDAALALMQRRQASWGNAEAKRRCEIELLEAEKSASDNWDRRSRRRVWGYVRLSKEAFDRALEIDEGSEDAALETSFAQLGEEALDSIEPGDRFRRVVEHETGMAFKPTPHLGCLWLP